MARQQAAGSMIVDQLRDRIVSGLYLGRWAPGERLPSIRDVADAENVDRKTAAAAYRRLQMEGLVRVRPRSGVYLRGSEPERTGGPLERLHRRWLENAYEGARAIGLDTSTMLKLIQAVALIEKQRIPVLEHDGAQAEAIALEIAERLGVNAVPVQLQDVDPSDPLIATAPFLVTTPYQGANVRRIAGSRQVVEVSCAREVVEELSGSMRRPDDCSSSRRPPTRPSVSAERSSTARSSRRRSLRTCAWSTASRTPAPPHAALMRSSSGRAHRAPWSASSASSIRLHPDAALRMKASCASAARFSMPRCVPSPLSRSVQPAAT